MVSFRVALPTAIMVDFQKKRKNQASPVGNSAGAVAGLIKLLNAAARHRLGEFLRGRRRTALPRALLALYGIPFGLWREPPADRYVRLRMALEELGPVYIKFGQLLSTRRDFLAPELADELRLLQDQVPPFTRPSIKELVGESLAMPVGEVFARIDAEPLASASVAQVHAAVLRGGEEVVVKVIRPGIGAVIDADIGLLKWAAALIDRNHAIGRRLRLVEIARDYEKTINDELNLLLEGASTARLRTNFLNSDKLYVPKVYSEYSRSNLLVMERVRGVPVNDVGALRAAGVDLRKLAENGVAVFFTQVLEHNFFHADMHPGNILVNVEEPETPRYIALDCAIIGSLSRADQDYMARNLLAIFRRDYRRVAELHIASGWVSRNTRPEEFESTIRSLCEPIFQRPLGEISFGGILLQLFIAARRFDMRVQPSLVLLQKTLLHIEGLGRQLYPELNLWETALPNLRAWEKKRLSPLAWLEQIRERLPDWVSEAPLLPDLAFDAAGRANQLVEIGETLIRRQEVVVKQQLRRRRLARRGGFICLVAALLALIPPIGAAMQSLPTASLALALAGLSLLFFAR